MGDFAFSATVDQGESTDSSECISDFKLVRINLSQNKIIEDVMQTDSQTITEDNMDITVTDGSDTVEASNKRRRVDTVDSKARKIKSTAELFFRCLEKAGGRKDIPDERLFALLADVRLA